MESHKKTELNISGKAEVMVARNRFFAELGGKIFRAEVWMTLGEDQLCVAIRVARTKNGYQLRVFVNSGATNAFWPEEAAPGIVIDIVDTVATATAHAPNIDKDGTQRPGPRTRRVPLGSIERV